MNIIGYLMLVLALAYLGYALFGEMLLRFGNYEDRYLASAGKQLDALLVFVSAEDLLRLNLVVAVLMALAGAMTAIRSAPLVMVMLGIVGGALGFAIPRAILSILVYRRRMRLLQQLPDALGVIVNGMKAGRALPQAMQMVVDEMPNPVSQEFRLLLRELGMGVSMAECADRLVARIPLTDVRLFALVLRLSARLGGDITEPLQNAAQTIRNRFAVEKKVKAMTSQVRFRGVLIACMPLIIFLLLSWMAPDLMSPIMGTRAGLVVLIVIVILQSIGGAMMWKLSKIKY